MNKDKILIIALVVLGLSTLTLGGLYIKEQIEIRTQSDLITDFTTVDEQDFLEIDEYYTNLPLEELSQEEIDGLILMREEEKLAHDVYTTLYEIWGQKIFTNISDSEQTHTDMVLELLNKYDIEDPVTDSTVGVFQDTNLLSLYNDLVELGKTSLVDALTVGATVEDLDIYDLNNLMLQADNEDILAVYQNLKKGSRNHLRSFTNILNRNGETYTPQYISSSEYQSIINTPSENGIQYDSNGEER